MFSLLNIFDGKPDHPLYDLREARKIIAELPADDPFKALDEIAAWLGSIVQASGFQPEVRTEIIMLLDETGQPLHARLQQLYLGEPHLQDFQGMHQWLCMHGFMRALSEAYTACLFEYQKAEKKPWYLKDNMPLLCVRQLRAVALLMKLELMRYVSIEQRTWEQLYQGYNLAEACKIADSMVYAYPKQIVHTNAQRELLRALILHSSAPDTLAPDQIEVSSRIAARMVSFFEFSEARESDCTHYIDLARAAAPAQPDDKLEITDTMRFFGAVKAVPKLKEIIDQNERSLIRQELRFGNEFSPDGKLTVLKHLKMYWSKTPPQRSQERIAISSAIEVMHGFRAISQRVASIDLKRVLNLPENEASALREQSKINLAAVDNTVYGTESWIVLDACCDGIGGLIPMTAGTWVKIGALCGFKSLNSQIWRVGMIRRLQTDACDALHVGIEILAKKPMSVWLRSLGQASETASNWDSGSGAFKYKYLPVILIPDALNSYMNATMLMESGSFQPNNICEMMMGEKSRDIKLIRLLDEGSDYEQVSFHWLDSAKN